MYKHKLQELCQQRQWALPLYTSAKEGPDHNPRFRASVTVRGATFDDPQEAISRTSKLAQNEAARIAFHHFAADAAAPATPPPPPPSVSQVSRPSSVRIEGGDNPEKNEELKGCGSDANAITMDMTEMRYLYKSQLQIYAQKRNLNLPIYDHVREGSLHAPRFKASVTVDGQTFESPQYLGTLKDAEHAAAKVALMSLSAVGIQEEEHGFYKNFLQELAQKENFAMPTYKTLTDGPLHMPTFISTIEIEGEEFHGDAAKTRKQAENSAARVAWTRLRERNKSRRLHGGFLSKLQNLDISDQLRAKDESIDAHVRSSLPHDDGTRVTEEVGGNGNDNSTARLQKPNSTEKRGQSPTPPSSDALYARLRDPFMDESESSDDETSPVAPPSHDLSQSPADAASVCHAENGESSSLCNRVLIYPRKPDFQIPPGTKLLPPSDEMWVAVSVEPAGRVAGSTRVSSVKLTQHERL